MHPSRCRCRRSTALRPACSPAANNKRPRLRSRVKGRRRGNLFCVAAIGDVENGGTFDAWNAARTRLENLFDLAPAALACDVHPSYLSSQWAREQARKCNLPLVEVQHHHAHIARRNGRGHRRGPAYNRRARPWHRPLTAPEPAPMVPFGAASFLLPALAALSAPRICAPGRSPAGRPPCATPAATPLPCSVSSACLNTRGRAALRRPRRTNT